MEQSQIRKKRNVIGIFGILAQCVPADFIDQNILTVKTFFKFLSHSAAGGLLHVHSLLAFFTDWHKEARLGTSSTLQTSDLGFLFRVITTLAEEKTDIVLMAIQSQFFNNTRVRNKLRRATLTANIGMPQKPR